MALALAPHVHLAVLGDDIVLLDVTADAYLCVPDGVAQLRPSADRASVSPRENDALAAMVQAGLVKAAAASGGQSVLSMPRRDLDAGDPGPLTVRDGLRLAAALLDLAAHYRGRQLGDIVGFIIRKTPHAGPESDRAETARLAQQFRRVAVWLPMPRKCLARSFVLLRFLQRSGLTARWVFGVRTWPFAAHCWLQVGDTVLDDHVERLAAYAPILAVG